MDRDIVSVIKHADGGVCPAAATYLFRWTEEEISPHDSRVKRCWWCGGATAKCDAYGERTGLAAGRECVGGELGDPRYLQSR
jgi:hypothetical protein